MILCKRPVERSPSNMPSWGSPHRRYRTAAPTHQPYHHNRPLDLPASWCHHRPDRSWPARVSADYPALASACQHHRLG